jgi:uncharacterized protein YndB with AHSA1/START domain
MTSTSPSFTTTFSLDRTPDEVFDAITDVRGWWSGTIEGATAELGDDFTYRYEDIHYSRIRITEMIPGKRVVWRVLDTRLSYVDDQTEWINTEMIFDITGGADGTTLRFTHEGLVPDFECYQACSTAWSSIINNNLRNLIAGTDAR